jgi:hypothetical protein
MRRSTLRAVFLVLSAAAAITAHSETRDLTNFHPTGNDFVSTCRKLDPSSDLDRLGQCFAYVHGVLDGFVDGGINNAPRKTDGSSVVKGWPCVPDRATNGQLVKVVLTYADKHPEELHYPASEIVLRSLIAAWGSPPTCP